MAKDIKLIGFNFLKANVERNPEFKGDLKMKSDMKILSVEKDKLDLVKQETIKIGFEFKIDYGDLGKLELQGTLGLMLDSKTQKDLLSQWKENKISEELQVPILNIILQKSTLKALQLEEEFNLPLHMQLPRLDVKKPEEPSK
jgi:hypothetical protein